MVAIPTPSLPKGLTFNTVETMIRTQGFPVQPHGRVASSFRLQAGVTARILERQNTSMLNGYKAVFFDVGGTLLRVYPSVGEVYARHARAYGFDGSAQALNKQFSVEWKNLGGLEGLGKKKGPAVEKEFWRTLVRQTFEPFGGLKNFDAYFAHIYDVFRDASSWRVYEDVLESGILNTLKNRGIVLGVISNWDSRLPQILKNTGLAEYFQFILASTVVGSAKPDAGIFEEALRLSGIPADQACHIGDEVHTDFEGARNAGLHAILIDRKGGPHRVTPQIKSFRELV